MKAKKILLLAALIAAVSCFLIWFVPSHYKKVTYESASFHESAKLLKNPYCGFFRIFGFALTEQGEEQASQLSEHIKNDPHQLILLQINLKEYRDAPLSETALSELDTLLSACDTLPKSYILRFHYDWDGNSKETEPDELSLILHHMEQVAPVVNRHKSGVYLLQGIFTGDCGEMHGSPHTRNDEMVTLITKLHSLIDPEIYLSVRTPTHYRTIVQSFEPLTSDAAYSGSLPARLGLFNDGMLGSDFDLGTYGPDSLEGQTEFTAKGTRPEEIAFQNALCNYVPNGGECVLDNPYNDFEPALKDLSDMHVSYLNRDYDAQVLEKWRSSVYRGTDVFSGMNGYDYIEAHLGYRYVITSSALTYERFRSQTATVQVSLKNEGFASAYRPFVSTVTLVADDPAASGFASVSYRADYDNRLLTAGSSDTVSAAIDTSVLAPGTYRAYFRMTDTTKYPSIMISFANEEAMTDYGILVGTITVE